MKTLFERSFIYFFENLSDATVTSTYESFREALGSENVRRDRHSGRHLQKFVPTSQEIASLCVHDYRRTVPFSTFQINEEEAAHSWTVQLYLTQIPHLVAGITRQEPPVNGASTAERWEFGELLLQRRLAHVLEFPARHAADRGFMLKGRCADLYFLLKVEGCAEFSRVLRQSAIGPSRESPWMHFRRTLSHMLGEGIVNLEVTKEHAVSAFLKACDKEVAPSALEALSISAADWYRAGL